MHWENALFCKDTEEGQVYSILYGKTFLNLASVRYQWVKKTISYIPSEVGEFNWTKSYCFLTIKKYIFSPKERWLLRQINWFKFCIFLLILRKRYFHFTSIHEILQIKIVLNNQENTTFEFRRISDPRLYPYPRIIFDKILHVLESSLDLFYVHASMYLADFWVKSPAFRFIFVFFSTKVNLNSVVSGFFSLHTYPVRFGSGYRSGRTCFFFIDGRIHIRFRVNFSRNHHLSLLRYCISYIDFYFDKKKLRLS